MQKYIAVQISEAQRAMAAMVADEALLARMEAAAGGCINCMRAGNGGSAADALLSAPNLMRLPIHDIAFKEGQLL